MPVSVESTPTFTRQGPWVEIDLGTLAENIRSVQSTLGSDTEAIFVVKADAYGHGLVPVACRAAESGVNWFGVAYTDEAQALRNALPDSKILLLGVADPEDVPALIAQRVIPIVVSEEHGLALAVRARELGETLDVHIKVDTGMERLGIDWQEAGPTLERLLQEPSLNVTGICSHFATVEPDHSGTGDEQYSRFESLPVPDSMFRHISSSRAFLCNPNWDTNGVRLGIVVYGYGASDPEMRVRTRPILQWKCRVMQVKSVSAGAAVGYYGTHVTRRATRLAVLAAGYADGYLRTLSNRAFVLIGGRRCKVVGRVSMNWITVDVGPDSEVQAGDEAVLIGRQGNEELWAGDLAKLCRTIPYEILTNIKPGLEHRYVG